VKVCSERSGGKIETCHGMTRRGPPCRPYFWEKPDRYSLLHARTGRWDLGTVRLASEALSPLVDGTVRTARSQGPDRRSSFFGFGIVFDRKRAPIPESAPIASAYAPPMLEAIASCVGLCHTTYRERKASPPTGPNQGGLDRRARNDSKLFSHSFLVGADHRRPVCFCPLTSALNSDCFCFPSRKLMISDPSGIYTRNRCWA